LINTDHSLLKYFSSEGVCLDESKFALQHHEKALISILNPKADEKVDRVGGFIAERMVRSAFAPMLKFSSLS